MKMTRAEMRSRFWKSIAGGLVLAGLIAVMVYWMMTDLVRPDVAWKPHGLALLVAIYSLFGFAMGFVLLWSNSMPQRIADLHKRERDDAVIAQARAIERRREEEAR